MRQRLCSSSRKRLLLILCVTALAIVLGVTRPWLHRQPECAMTVQSGQSIQEAIDAAEGGDIICLAGGEWTGRLVIDKSLSLVGRGAGTTTIQAALISDPIGQVTDQDAGPITVRLEGLTISGRGGGCAVEISGRAAAEVRDCVIFGKLYGVQVSDSASLTLTSCTVSDSPQRGIALTGSAQASIVDCQIQGNTGHALWLSGSAQATLLASEVSGNRGHGLWLRDEAKVALNDSLVSDNGECGILLTGQSEVQLARSQVSGNAAHGIMAEDAVRLEMTDTNVLSNWHGIEVTGAARATIASSTISLSRFDGIRVQRSASVAVSASVISGNRRGMWITGTSQAELRDCLIEENAGYGLFCSSSSGATGGGNQFRANGLDMGGNLPGALRVPLKEPRESVITWPDPCCTSLQEAVDVLLPGGRLILEPGEYTAALTIQKKLIIEASDGQVTLRGKSDALAVLSLVDGADLHLSGVTVSGGAEGLLISAGASTLVVNSTVSLNGDGINLSHSASAELIDSSITGNEGRGVFVGDTAQATVTASIISDNSEHGIVAADSAQITITGCTIASNGGAGGVVVWGSPQAVIGWNTIAENAGFGVAIFERPTFRTSPWLFRGRISGSSNVLEGNSWGNVSVPELDFLSTAEGGELDMRL